MFLGRDYGQAKAYSETTASEIDFEIKEIITKQYDAAQKILNEYSDCLADVANLLLEKETISAEEFEACFSKDSNIQDL